MSDTRQVGAGSLTGRRPVHADDPDEVFVLEANLLAQYSESIGRDVAKIKAQCSAHAELQAAAAAYLAEIGSNIPDPIIRSAVRRLSARAIEPKRYPQDVCRSRGSGPASECIPEQVELLSGPNALPLQPSRRDLNQVPPGGLLWLRSLAVIWRLA